MMFRPFRRPFTNPVVLAIVGLLLLALGARLAFAQPTPTPTLDNAAPGYTMLYVLNNDTLGVERVEQSDRALVGDLRLRGQPRIRWTQTLNEAANTSTLLIEAWRPGATDADAPMQQLVLRVGGDSAYVFAAPAADAPLGAPQATLPSRAGAAWMVNQSLSHAAWVLQRSPRSARTGAGADTAWVMLAAGAQLTPMSITQRADTTMLTAAGLDSYYIFSGNGELLQSSVPSQKLFGYVIRGEEGASNTLLGRFVTPEAAVSYDAPDDAPYIAEPVRVSTPMGHALAGTLTKPREATGPFPVAITISGSGPQERDAALAGIEGYRLFRQIADTLGRRGIAVLRLDDRGVGQSTGDFGTATSRDFAQDVQAAVLWLRTRSDVDGARIALIGHSEGGLIAPLVASTDSVLAAIALLAGPAYTGARIIAFQQRSAIAQLYPSSFASARDSMFKVAQQQLDSTVSRSPWLQEFIRYDPVPTARTVRVPVLVLQGERDLQVTAEQADTLAAAFRAGGNTDVTVRVLAQTNHLFQRDASGVPGGYGTLPDRAATKEALGVLADWLVLKLRPAAP